MAFRFLPGQRDIETALGYCGMAHLKALAD
jgi:hypothetical protein